MPHSCVCDRAPDPPVRSHIAHPAFRITRWTWATDAPKLGQLHEAVNRDLRNDRNLWELMEHASEP